MLKGFFEGQKFLEGDMKLQNLEIDNQIGRGNSDVFLASINQHKVAIKQTQIKNDYQYKNFLQQISMLKKLSQNNDSIIKYEGYFVTQIKEQKSKSYSNKKYGYLLMQRALMNLGQYIRSKQVQKIKLSYIQIINSISLMLNGFTFLQSMMIAHCDIKPQNILILDQNKLNIKICDVGSCKTIDKQQQNQSTIKGTLSFLAPQLIKIDDIKITSINPFRSDVYSFGLVILYMITGKKFTSQERKQISEEVYYQIINQWIKYAGEIVNQDIQIIEILKKALEFDLFKRPLFKELKLLFQTLGRKRKMLFDNRLKKNKRQQTQTQNQSVQTKKQGYLSQKPKLPKLNSLNMNNTSASTLMSFHSRTRLTGKVGTTTNSKNSKSQSKKSSDKSQKNNKSKRSNGKQSKSKMSPFQKTTMYSTFSIDKSKLSILGQSKKIIYITSQNFNFIPYENLNQEEKTFVLFCPNILFECALNVVIKKQCSIQVFDKLSGIKSGSGLYLDYSGVQMFGVDENIPTLTTFQYVHLNLENSSVESGYNNLLRFLCPISIRGLFLQLTGSQISYNQVKMQIERLKNKDITKLDLCWDKSPLNYDQFTQMNQKISKLPLKKFIFSLSSAYLKANEKSRWLLPSKCKTLYLNFPNNFLTQAIGSLSISLAELSELKEFYLNLQNNCLNDTDIKILIKSLQNLKSLEKTVLNFSWNPITKGIYCFQQLSLLSKISSLQLRLSKCGLSFEQFQQIFSHLITLFNSSLKILKLTYDRKITKNMLHNTLQKIIKEEINQNLKLDIIGYNYCNFMIYIKKKSQGGTQKNIKLKIKQKSHQIPQLTSSKNIQSTSSLTANRTIPYIPVSKQQRQQKQQQDQFSTIPNLHLKQISDKNDKKGQSNTHKMCQTLFTTYPTYQCYICLGCIQNRQMSKFQYFCRACIENCQHKGHNIVRTYDKRICNCAYNQKCIYREQDNNQFICAQKLGIQYKKQYQCLKCNPKKSFCQGCIIQCRQGHGEWVQSKASGFFQCYTNLISNQSMYSMYKSNNQLRQN